MFDFLHEEPPATDDLVLRAMAGDLDAYNRLFALLQPRLILFIRFRLGKQLAQHVSVEDVLQETYLQAHSSFASFEQRGCGAFCRWLYQIVDHRLRDISSYVGAKKRRPPGALRADSALLGHAASQTSPPSACARNEQHERLLEAVEGLSAEERAAVALRYFHAETVGAVGAELGLDESATRRLLNRARLKLGRALRDAPP